MRGLMHVWAVFVKNIKRMLRSRLTMAILFFGPFLILLLVQGVYHDVQHVNIKTGLIAEQNTEDIQRFTDRLTQEGLEVYWLGSEDCITRMKQGFIDVCIELDFTEEHRETTFYVDYSKMNLVNTISEILTGKVQEEADDLRVMFLDQIMENVESSGDLIGSMSEEFNAAFDQLDTDNRIGSLESRLASSDGDISEVEDSLSLMEAKTRESYTEVSRSLRVFEDAVEDVRDQAAEQRQEIAELRAYGRDCDAVLPEFTEEYVLNLSEENPERLQEEAEEYGRCRCVEFYDGNLDDVEDELGKVISDADGVLDEISLTESRNDEFFDQTMTTINLQRSQLASFDTQKDSMGEELRTFNNELNLQILLLKDRLKEVEEKVSSLTSDMSVMSGEVNNPILVSVKPIAVAQDFMVYLFPLVYFFIVMFISLVFSSTYIYGERSAFAGERNMLSPLKKVHELSGTFLSLTSVVLAQAVIIVLLGNWQFSLGLGLGGFLKVMVVTVCAVSSFVLTGMVIGHLFRSELVAMLLSIATSIVLFLYSHIIKPVELMTPFIGDIVSLNPYALASLATSRIVLFGMPLGLFARFFAIALIGSATLVGVLALLTRKERREQ